MNMFAPFEPQTLIRGIQCAKTTDRELTRRELSLLQAKLLQAEENHGILRLARGDGRKDILDEILADDQVIFGWGLKSQHAFHEQSELRDLLEPDQADINGLKKLVKLYQENFAYHYARKEFRNAGANHAKIVQQLYAIIENEQVSHEDLLCIKNWLCMTLHTAGYPGFRSITPWVSVSCGAKRYKTAYFFGKGKSLAKKQPTKHSGTAIHRFVIFDTWVHSNDEHYTFEYTKFLIHRLSQLGLPWYPDRHHEIMLKYAIYPQNLIGYYYFEDDYLCYYYVNPHYLACMTSQPEFKIGDHVDIDQTGVDFPANNPYRMIYTRDGNAFSVYKRR